MFRDEIAIAELAQNIRRNLNLIHEELNIKNERDSNLVDLVNHIDAIAQQIIYTCEN